MSCYPCPQCCARHTTYSLIRQFLPSRSSQTIRKQVSNDLCNKVSAASVEVRFRDVCGARASRSAKEHRLWNHIAVIASWFLFFQYCVILGKLINFPGLSFSIYKMGIISHPSPGVVVVRIQQLIVEKEL